MRLQGGGVGYYPSSGSPFVHVDTGSVRSWPRMTRSQLLALFPDGETLYLPADGNPLPGYQRALGAAPVPGRNGAGLSRDPTKQDGRQSRNGGGWLSRVFGGGQDEVEDEETAVAAAPAAAPPAAAPPAGEQQLAAAAAEVMEDARLPRARPGTELEQMMAVAATDLRQDSVASGDQLAMVALADVPLPRARPQADVLAGTLEAAAQPDALAVQGDDTLAALAASAQENLVIAAQENAAALPTDADSAILAGFAAVEDPAAAPADNTALAAANALSEGQNTPRPRPLTLAFAAAGLPAVEVPDAPALAPVPQAAAPAAPAQTAAPAAQPSYDEDADTLRLLVGAPATQDGAFAMPQPGGAPGLYTAPESAAEVMNLSDPEEIPVERFQVASAPAEESFFSRLFVSLVE